MTILLLCSVLTIWAQGESKDYYYLKEYQDDGVYIKVKQ